MQDTATLDGFIREHAIYATPEPATRNPNIIQDDDEWSRGARHWLVILQRPDVEPMRVPFSQGSGHTKPPTAADVLDCLASDVASVRGSGGDWLDWAEELGYAGAKALRQARNAFESITRTDEELQRFLGDDALEQLLWNVERL